MYCFFTPKMEAICFLETSVIIYGVTTQETSVDCSGTFNITASLTEEAKSEVWPDICGFRVWKLLRFTEEWLLSTTVTVWVRGKCANGWKYFKVGGRVLVSSVLGSNFQQRVQDNGIISNDETVSLVTILKCKKRYSDVVNPHRKHFILVEFGNLGRTYALRVRFVYFITGTRKNWFIYLGTRRMS
jgi:hypothetical protein